MIFNHLTVGHDHIRVFQLESNLKSNYSLEAVDRVSGAELQVG